MRIKRLVDLGFSLPEIAAMGESDDHPEQALRELDAELAETIDRLQRARDELGELLKLSAPTDLPLDFVAPDTAAKMTDADRKLVVVLSRVLGPRGRQIYADMMRETPDDPAATELDNLPADADEATRRDLAERLAPYIRAVRQARPGAGRLPRRCASREALRGQGDRRRDGGPVQPGAAGCIAAGRRDPA